MDMTPVTSGTGLESENINLRGSGGENSAAPRRLTRLAEGLAARTASTSNAFAGNRHRPAVVP